MKTKHPIGILGATGMVGQRYIQLLENHPWFEVAWIAASDRSSGKTYAEAAKWRLDTPLPERIANMTVSAAEPEGAPKIVFASIDAAYARELEPKFAAAGCAVVSNSSAFRMAPNVPLVLQADHGVSYGTVAAVLGQAYAAGLTKVGLAMEQDHQGAPLPLPDAAPAPAQPVSNAS